MCIINGNVANALPLQVLTGAVKDAAAGHYS